MLAAPLDILKDEPLGVGCLGAFVLLLIFVLVWALVIAPRRARKLLAEFEQLGYVEIDLAAPELVSALDSLAPIMLEGTTRFQEEPPRQTLNALVCKSGSHPRYVVNVAQADTFRDHSVTTWQTLFLESKPLRLDTEFSTRLSAQDHIGRGREERFSFQKIEVPGLSPEFASLFSVYSKDGRPVALSARLQEALLDASRNIPKASHSNTRFGPTGWGISASGAWLDRRALRNLLDAGKRISAAL